MIEKENSVAKIIEGSFRFMVETYIHVPEIIAFIFLMDHDHNFEPPKEVKDKFLKIGNNLLELGKNTGEISGKINAEDVIVIVFGLPVKLVELRRKEVFTTDTLGEKDVKNMVGICMKALG